MSDELLPIPEGFTTIDFPPPSTPEPGISLQPIPEGYKLKEEFIDFPSTRQRLEELLIDDPAYKQFAEQLNQVTENAKNPEEEKTKIYNTLILSALGAGKPNELYGMHDGISKGWIGKEEKPQGFFKRLWNTFKAGFIPGKMRGLVMRQIMGDDSPELEEQIQAFEKQFPTDSEAALALPTMLAEGNTVKNAAALFAFLGLISKRSPELDKLGKQAGKQVLETALLSAANILPMAMQSQVEGLKQAVLTAGPLALGGLLAGPQAAPVTIPMVGAGLTVGQRAGAMRFIGEIEAAMSYRQLIREGIEHKIAAPISVGIGIINAPLEYLQYSHLFKPFTKYFQSRIWQDSVHKATQKVVADGLLTRIGKGMAGGARRTLQEATEEGVQETVTGLGREIAIEINNRVQGTELEHEWNQILPRALKAFGRAGLGFAVLQIPGTFVSMLPSKQVVEKGEVGKEIKEEPLTREKYEKYTKAIKTEDGRIHADPNATSHLEISELQVIDPATVTESGRIVKGRYMDEDQFFEWFQKGAKEEDLPPMAKKHFMQRIMETAPQVTKEQAEAIVTLAETRAESEGLSLEEHLQKYYAPEIVTSVEPSAEALYQVGPVWHGTAAEFEKFKTEHVGRGQGAASFGWGLYFSDVEGVAKGYAAQLAAKFQVKETKARNLYEVTLRKDKINDIWLEWYEQVPKNIISRLQRQAADDSVAYELANLLKNPEDRQRFYNMTGQELYEYLVRDYEKGFVEERGEAAERVSNFLRRAGVDGIKYPTGTLGGADVHDYSSGTNYVVFDEDAVTIEEHVLYQGPKGAVSFDEGKALIHATKATDFSTFVHEMGHIWRRQLEGEDLRTIEEWAGVKKGNWTTETEEKFANGLEQYLQEESGAKGFSDKLNKVFDKFKEWLENIYQRFAKTHMPDEVRRVYEGLLLSPKEQDKRLANKPFTEEEMSQENLSGLLRDIEEGGMIHGVGLNKAQIYSVYRATRHQVDALKEKTYKYWMKLMNANPAKYRKIIAMVEGDWDSAAFWEEQGYTVIRPGETESVDTIEEKLQQEEPVAGLADLEEQMAVEAEKKSAEWTPHKAAETAIKTFKDVSQELGGAYQELREVWFQNRDERLYLAKVEGKSLHKKIKEVLGKKNYDKDCQLLGSALHFYIDSKRNPQHIDLYYKIINSDFEQATDMILKQVTAKEELEISLTNAQLKTIYNNLQEIKPIVDRMQNLSVEELEIAEQINQSDQEAGRAAKDDAEIIHNTLENHVGRVWDRRGKEAGPILRKFGTTTHHSKHRVFDTIIQGYIHGHKLKVLDAAANLQILKEELIHTIADKRFLKSMLPVKDADNNPLLSLTWDKPEGYEEVKHPSFLAWAFAGKVEEGKTYGKNFLVTEEGTVLEKRKLYAPAEIAKNLNNMLGQSFLKGMGFFDAITKWNAILKRVRLIYSLFHPLAYVRSYYLPTSKKTWKEMNPAFANREGRRMVENAHPTILLGVRNGLTLGIQQEYDEMLIGEGTALGKILDKIKPAKEAREFMRNMHSKWMEFVFGTLGTGYKSMAFVHEYTKEQQKRPNEDPNVVARDVADLMNDDFGGLHLQRMGRNPTVQHIFRILMLAPDWCCVSDTRAMTKTGWKYYHELIVGKDEILAFNPDTKTMQWLLLNDIYVNKNYSGKIVKIKSHTRSIKMTPEHKCYVYNISKKNYEIVSAKDLNTAHRILRSAEFNLPIKSLYDDIYIKLVGWFVTDGYTKRCTNKLSNGDYKNYYYGKITQSKPDMVALLQKFGMNEHTDSSYWNHDKFKANHYKHTFTIPKKHFKQMQKDGLCDGLNWNFLSKLTKRQLQLLYDTMFLGDGTGQKRFCGKEKEVFYMTLIQTMLGLPTTFYQQEKNCWRTRVLSDYKKYISCYKKPIETNYSGTIWCPSVDTGFWLAEREGLIFITGNTESNVRSMLKVFKLSTDKQYKVTAEQRKMFQAFWVRAMVKGLSATVFLNFILAGGDPDRFLENYRRMWKETIKKGGSLRIYDIDITPIYKAFGGKTAQKKYWTLIGHFRDPTKFIVKPVTSAKHKSSMIVGMGFDLVTQEDWAGRGFTKFSDLLSTGETVKWHAEKGFSDYSFLPSYIINQLIGSTPIPIGNLISWISGETEGFDAIANSIGLGVRTTYEKEEKIKKKKRPY